MVETIEKDSPRIAENLTLKLQIPMVVPKEVRELKLAGQLPSGDIAYFDVAEPDTLRLVDQTTWKPVTKKGVEIRLSIDRIPRKFAGVILHIPQRTPENSFEDEISHLSGLLRRASEKEDGIITQQSLGVLFVVEDRGGDQRVGWRQRQLSEGGLVVDKTHGGSVIVTDSHIISFGRRPKQHSAVNLTTGERSQYMVGPFIDRIRRDAEREGFDSDTSSLEKEIRATRNPPMTIANLRDGGGVVYETMDFDGKRITVDRSGRTEIVTPSRDALQRLAQTTGDEKKSLNSKVKHKGGDVVDLKTKCDCGGHLQRQYYEKAGRVRTLLFSNIVCPSHPVGSAIIEEGIYEGALNLLSSNVRKASRSDS